MSASAGQETAGAERSSGQQSSSNASGVKSWKQGPRQQGPVASATCGVVGGIVRGLWSENWVVSDKNGKQCARGSDVKPSSYRPTGVGGRPVCSSIVRQSSYSVFGGWGKVFVTFVINKNGRPQWRFGGADGAAVHASSSGIGACGYLGVRGVGVVTMKN